MNDGKINMYNNNLLNKNSILHVSCSFFLKMIMIRCMIFSPSTLYQPEYYALYFVFLLCIIYVSV